MVSVVLFLFLGVLIVLFSFMLSSYRLLNCLIVVENFNILLLLCCVLSQCEESRILFISLMVVFTVEIVLGLSVLTRLWGLSNLMGIVGW